MLARYFRCFVGLGCRRPRTTVRVDSGAWARSRSRADGLGVRACARGCADRTVSSCTHLLVACACLRRARGGAVATHGVRAGIQARGQRPRVVGARRSSARLSPPATGTTVSKNVEGYPIVDGEPAHRFGSRPGRSGGEPAKPQRRARSRCRAGCFDARRDDRRRRCRDWRAFRNRSLTRRSRVRALVTRLRTR